jgi:hypothetical protein
MIYIAAALAIGIFSFLFGFIVSSFFKFDLKVSKKEDYEAKVQQFEILIKDLEDKLEAGQEIPEEGRKYHPLDMFPANLPRDYGLPRSLDEEV